LVEEGFGGAGGGVEIAGVVAFGDEEFAAAVADFELYFVGAAAGAEAVEEEGEAAFHDAFGFGGGFLLESGEELVLEVWVGEVDGAEDFLVEEVAGEVGVAGIVGAVEREDVDAVGGFENPAGLAGVDGVCFSEKEVGGGEGGEEEGEGGEGLPAFHAGSPGGHCSGRGGLMMS
jgi:hypothetical protein